MNLYYLLIVDRSSSMNSFRSETIQNLNNEFAMIREEQNKHPEQKYFVSLVTFSNDLTYNFWKKPIEEVKDITEKDYITNGYTSLLDSIGFSTNLLKEEIGKEIEEGESVVYVSIMTDGAENSSKEYDRTKINELITTLKKGNKWTFSFIGCDEDTIKDAQDLGIPMMNTVAYTATSEGMHKMSKMRSAMFSNYTMNVSSYASGKVDLENLDLDNLTNIDPVTGAHSGKNTDSNT